MSLHQLDRKHFRKNISQKCFRKGRLHKITIKRANPLTHTLCKTTHISPSISAHTRFFFRWRRRIPGAENLILEQCGKTKNIGWSVTFCVRNTKAQFVSHSRNYCFCHRCLYCVCVCVFSCVTGAKKSKNFFLFSTNFIFVTSSQFQWFSPRKDAQKTRPRPSRQAGASLLCAREFGPGFSQELSFVSTSGQVDAESDRNHMCELVIVFSQLF